MESLFHDLSFSLLPPTFSSSVTSSFVIVVLKFDQPTMTLTVMLGGFAQHAKNGLPYLVEAVDSLFLQQEITHKSGGVCILGFVNMCNHDNNYSLQTQVCSSNFITSIFIF